VVRERRALREAGGPGRVLDVDRVVELQLGLAGGELVRAHALGVAQKRLPAVLQHQRLAQLPAAPPDLTQHSDVVGGAEPLRQHQEAGPRLGERVLQLRRLVGGVDVDQDGAHSRGRVLDHDPLVPVGGPDADAVAPADAARHEPASGQPGLLPELAVRGPVALAADHERLTVAVTLDRPAKVVTDRLAEERDAAGTVDV
jgi:hypothetical protein